MLFTTNGVSNDITMIDTKAMKPVKSIKVGRYPWGVAIKASPEFVAGSKTSETR